MSRIVLIALALSFSASFAQAQSCTTQVADKKLAGAARTSFLTKCEKDAGASCDKQAAERKLAGAAKTSFVNKCVRDGVGG